MGKIKYHKFIYILSNRNRYCRRHKKENNLFFNLEEHLEFGEVRLAPNGKDLIYIISPPTR